MPKAKRSREDIEKELVRRIRAKGLENPERRGCPIILWEGDTFLVLYNGGLQSMESVDLKTLCAFSVDVHGDGATDPASANRYNTGRNLDTMNLTSAQFCEFTKVLEAYKDAEARKKLAMDAAVKALSQ